MPNKIEQEIEDLLARLDTFPPPKPWHVRLRHSIADRFDDLRDAIARVPFPRLNSGYVVLAAIFVAVMAYFMYDSLGGFGGIIIVGAILVFLAAFVLSLRRRSAPPTRYWRDRPIDVNKPGPDWRNRRRRR